MMRNKMRRLVGSVGLVTLPFITGFAYGMTSGSGEANLSVQNSWGSGYCANVSIANNGDTSITDWTVELDLKNATINNLWNGTLNNTVVTPMGNANISRVPVYLSDIVRVSLLVKLTCQFLASFSVEGGDSSGSTGDDSGGSTGGDSSGSTGDDSGGSTGVIREILQAMIAVEPLMPMTR
ncbi:cellulose binding domain-containing protein [Vibrio sp. PP-XX7]